MSPGVTTISIINVDYADPRGTGFHPPSESHPYWRNPEGLRVSVKEVWAGADPETKQRVFDITFRFFTDRYSAAFAEAESKGRIFRGSGDSGLLMELQAQLGPGHWLTK